MLNRFKTNIDTTNKLYIIGTPIGNIDDITIRAINTFKILDILYCEDTRITSLFLSKLGIKVPKIVSCNVVTENEVLPKIIEDLNNGLNVGYCSDAGMPGISDPGFLMVRECRKLNILVEIIPGVCAGITGIVGSGFTSNHFYFYGFLPSKHTQRVKELASLQEIESSIILYEAPHRLTESLEDIKEILGDREICLARELTKTYEEYLTGKISEVLPIVETLKGEFVLIVKGSDNTEIIDKLNSMNLEEHYKFYLDQNIDPKEAMKKVAKDLGVSKSDIYSKLMKK